MKTNSRIFIQTHDIVRLSGVHVRTARRILQRIRKHYGKPADAFVSFEEFCDYMKLREEKLKERVN